MLKNTKTIFILFLFAWSSLCYAQQWKVTYWNPIFGDAVGDNKSYSIASDPTGGVVITGFVASTNGGTDICTVKYDSLGNVMWASTNNGGYIDNKAYAITIDKQWNMIVTGYSQNQTSIKIRTIKYDSAGNVIWNMFYPDSGQCGDSKAYAIALDSYDNIYIAGYTTNFSNNTDYVVIKYNPSGVRQWVENFDGTANGNDTASSITIVADNAVAVTGNSWNGQYNIIETVSYNLSGGQQWEKHFGNSESKGNAITADAYGNVYITGYTTSAQTYEDILTAKYSNLGNLSWFQIDTGAFYDYGKSIGLTSTNDVVVAGVTSGSLLQSSENYITIKYDGVTGANSWSQQYNGTGNSTDVPNKLVVSPIDNTIYVTGASNSTNDSGSQDMLTITYSATGDTISCSRVSADTNSADIANDITIDQAGNVYITGYTIPVGGQYNVVGRGSKMFTAKLGNLNHKTTKVLPGTYRLYQNYPNPFNPSTVIKFDISKTENVKLVVYDILGRTVQTLVDNNLAPGNYSIPFSNRGLASGVYFYQLTAGNYRDIKKMVLIK